MRVKLVPRLDVLNLDLTTMVDHVPVHFKAPVAVYIVLVVIAKTGYLMLSFRTMASNLMRMKVGASFDVLEAKGLVGLHGLTIEGAMGLAARCADNPDVIVVTLFESTYLLLPRAVSVISLV